MGERIQGIINNPTPNQQTLEEGLGALGLLGGSYLANRQGRASAYGVPLQLLGGGLLTSGILGGKNRDEQTKQNELSKYVSQTMADVQAPTKPEVDTALASNPALKGLQGQVADVMSGKAPSPSEFVGKMIGMGYDPDAALKLKESVFNPKTSGNFDYWFNSSTGEERVLPKGSAQPGPGWVTSSFKVGKPTENLTLPMRTELARMGVDPAKATKDQIDAAQKAMTERSISTAGLRSGASANAVIGAMGSKPYGMVSKSTVPVQVTKTKDGIIQVKPISPFKITYAEASKRPDINSIETSQVDKFNRLMSLPNQATQLKKDAAALLRDKPGGPAAWATRRLADFTGDPRAAKLATDLTILADNATGAFSKRSSQVIIEQLRHALAGNTLSAGAVAAAADALTNAANDESRSLIQEGANASNGEATGLIGPLSIGGAAPLGTTEPPPPPGYE